VEDELLKDEVQNLRDLVEEEAVVMVLTHKSKKKRGRMGFG